MAEDTFERVKSLILEQQDVEPDEVTLEAGIKEDLGFDSLDVVDFIMALEQEFDLEIEDEEAEKVTTVGDIVKFIEEKK